jgi:hypothetical protein
MCKSKKGVVLGGFVFIVRADRKIETTVQYSSYCSRQCFTALIGTTVKAGPTGPKYSSLILSLQGEENVVLKRTTLKV